MGRNDNFCAKCGKPGLLLCCDTCSNAFHFDCVGVDRADAEQWPTWSCAECESFETTPRRSSRTSSVLAASSAADASSAEAASSSSAAAASTAASSTRSSSPPAPTSPPSSPTPRSRAAFVPASTVARAAALTPRAPAMPPPAPDPPRPPTATPERRRVQGPTSALTSFLAEHGISSRHTNPYLRREASSSLDSPAPTPSPSTPSQRRASTPSASSSSPASSRAPRVVYREVSESESASDSEAQPKRGRRGSDKGGSKKARKDAAADKKRAKRHAKRNARLAAPEDGGDPPSSSSSDSDDSYAPRRRRRIAVCGRCGTAFDDNTFRCKNCAPSRTPRAAARPKRSAAEGSILSEVRGWGGKMLSLQELCMQYICRNINDVESLGVMEPDALTRICDITCRLRRLNADTVKLFLHDNMEMLRIIDCAALDAPNLLRIAQAGPSLTYLHLGNCGRMTDDVLRALVAALPNIVDLALSGLFLPSDACLADAVRALPRLERLMIADSPKVGARCTQALAECAADGLRAVRLVACDNVRDDSLEHLAKLGGLVELSLERCGLITDGGMAAVVATPRPVLEIFDVSGCGALAGADWSLAGTGAVKLSLGALPLLLDDALSSITRDLVRLELLDLSGSFELTDTSVEPLLRANAGTLRVVRLNGVRRVGRPVLEALLLCSHLTALDVSWIRAVDEGFIEGLAVHCRELRELRMWGINRASEAAVKQCEQRGVQVVGFEGRY